jgi:hypothetical protein
MERSRDADRRKKAQVRLEREAEKARCLICGKAVTPEDRCEDGNYLHRECAYQSSWR